jgi:hypothetical protein
MARAQGSCPCSAAFLGFVQIDCPRCDMQAKIAERD